MARPFEEAAFSRPVGEIGEPVETQFGFHLIKVLDREEDVPLTQEEATPKIRGFLKEEAAAAALKKWVEELRSAAEIVIM
jgi:parvulin-like peptidyl-prolyl isomerase